MAVDRRLLQEALSQGENITNRAIRGEGFDPRGGWGVAAAQIATAGIGAYAQNKARKALAEDLQNRTIAFESKFPQFAGLNFSPESQEAIASKAALSQIESRYSKKPDTSGGATGVLVDRYMQSTGAPFDQALAAVQGLARQGLTYDEQGNVMGRSGLLETKRQIKEAEAIGAKVGADIGETETTLKSLESKLPELEKTVSELSELGKKATYTKVGQLRDYIVRQTGQPVGEAAIARTKYITKVDNQVLPLLRDTFGAAFTKAEGDSLRATLGDASLSPEEKDAQLQSFIEQKKATVASTKRKAGMVEESQERVSAQAPQGQIKFLGFE